VSVSIQIFETREHDNIFCDVSTHASLLNVQIKIKYMYIQSTETFKFFSGVFFIEPSYNASPVIKECPSHTQRRQKEVRDGGGKTTGGLGEQSSSGVQGRSPVGVLGDEVPQKLKNF